MEFSFTSGKTKLSVELLKFHFGDIVGKIGECLTSFGNLTLESLIHFTKLSFEAVRKSLIILIQHNVVTYMKERALIQYYEEREPIPKRRVSTVVPERRSITGNDQTVYYILHTDRVVNLLYVGYAVNRVSNQMGEHSCEVFQQILSHGRLTYRMVEEKLSNKLEPEEIREGFENLVKHYSINILQKEISIGIRKVRKKDQEEEEEEEEVEEIEEEEGRTVPTLSLHSVRLKKLKKKKKKKKNLKKKKKKKKKLTKRRLKKRSRSEMLSINEDGDLDSSSSEEEMEEEDEDEEFMRSARKKVKLSHVKFEPNSMNEFDKDGDLWVVNFDSFLICDRLVKIVEYVGEVVDKNCENIVSEMINMTSPYTNLNDPYSRAIPLRDLKKRMKEERRMRSANLMQHIGVLERKQLVREVEGTKKSQYYIDFSAILEQCKILHVSRILERKFGTTASRIFMVLRDGKKYEEEGLGAKILMNEKQIRTILVKLLQYGYVQIHDLPKSADRAPQKTIHLWSVNLTALYRALVGEMYKTLRNLRIRGNREEDENLIPLVRNEVLEGIVAPNTEEQEILEKSYQKQDRIEGSMLRLLHFINLFENF